MSPHTPFIYSSLHPLTPLFPHLLTLTHSHIFTLSLPHLPQLLEVYKNLQHEHNTLKTFSEENEKKCQQKVSEMREVQALDHQAKAHMEEAFRLTLEEKDEKISVMQMQVGGGAESRGWGGHHCPLSLRVLHPFCF